MTNSTPRKLTLDLSFLDEGTYQMDVWQDGPNAARFGEDFVKLNRNVRKGDKLTISMAHGGGWVARIRPLPNPVVAAAEVP
ncbi:MAG: glycoside hydrolase family 97 C-terminal domain-containing protein [Candidatus Acidiferrales bacterium]